MKRLLVVVCVLALPAGFGPVASAATKHVWKPTQAQVDAARKIGRPVFWTNSIGMKFVLIPAGSFMMGTPLHTIDSTRDTPSPQTDETPQHRVKISRPFYLQTTEVTQAQYRAIMGKNPSHNRGSDRYPVERVSWHDAQEFIRRLNAREKTNKYRLPTEAEWEYATRAGTTTPYYCGYKDQCLKDYEWCDSTSGGTTNLAGAKKPNPWGVHDLACNVSEWCADWYAKVYYPNSPLADPQGPATGRKKVVRGGTPDAPWWENTSAHRGSRVPSERSGTLGFRVVRMP